MQKSRLAFTIVELLIGLAITAMLMVAVAAAFSASVANFRQNENMFDCLNKARQALFRMTTDIRTGRDFNLTDPANKLTFFTAAGQDITYDFRSADKKLYLITNSNGNQYLLCDNVTALTFTKTLTADSSDYKSIQISMTITAGSNQKTLSSAAVVRKNL